MVAEKRGPPLAVALVPRKSDGPGGVSASAPACCSGTSASPQSNANRFDVSFRFASNGENFDLSMFRSLSIVDCFFFAVVREPRHRPWTMEPNQDGVVPICLFVFFVRLSTSDSKVKLLLDFLYFSFSSFRYRFLVKNTQTWTIFFASTQRCG